MVENEEVTLMEFFAQAIVELRSLRVSINELIKALEGLKGEPIMLLGALVYDCVEEFKELKDLFKWYAETTTRGKYPGR